MLENLSNSTRREKSALATTVDGGGHFGDQSMLYEGRVVGWMMLGLTSSREAAARARL